MLFRMEIKHIKRSEGRSAVGAAAYRAGEKLKSDYTGEIFDYSRKNWVSSTQINLPDGADTSLLNREKLWNFVEAAEPSTNAQVAIEVLLALPNELSLQQQEDVVSAFIKHNFTSIGIVADASIHNPPVMDDLKRPLDNEGNPTDDTKEMIFRNPHCHILLSPRPMDKNGKFIQKSKIQYLVKKDGEEKAMTAEEFTSEGKANGWEKQFRYKADSWQGYEYLTPTEAKSFIEKGIMVERLSRTPKTAKSKSASSEIEKWRNKAAVTAWRKSWQDVLNKKFEELNLSLRADSRSYSEQGIDKEPGVHLGPEVNAIKRRNERFKKEGKEVSEKPYKESINALIDEINDENDSEKMMKKELTNLSLQTAHAVRTANHALESLIEDEQARSKIEQEEKKRAKNSVKLISVITKAMSESLAIINSLNSTLDSLPIYKGKERTVVEDKLKDEQARYAALSEYKKALESERFTAQTLSSAVSQIDFEILKSQLENQKESLDTIMESRVTKNTKEKIFHKKH